MDHEKSHYRLDENGRVTYSPEGSGEAASLKQRTAIGKHKDGSVYLRATDSDDLAKAKDAADALGVNYRQRRGGASHHGRVGSYEHLHFDHPSDALSVHAVLGYHLEQNAEPMKTGAAAEDHLSKLAGGLKHHVQGKDSRVDACMTNTRSSVEMTEAAHKEDTPESHLACSHFHKLAAEAHRAQASRPWTKGEGSHHAGLAVLHEEMAAHHGRRASVAHKRILAERKRQAEMQAKLEAQEEGREVKKSDGLGTQGAGTDLSTLKGGGALRAENNDEEISDATMGREIKKAAGKAKAGGETGKNGEHYKGGQFLPSTTNPKESHSSSVKGGGKREVAPYTWEHSPSPEHHPIWSRIKNFVDHAHLKATGVAKIHPMFNDDHPAVKQMSHGMDDLINKVDQFNNGERWFKKGLGREAMKAGLAFVNPDLTEPTPAQAEAGNYKKHHVTIHGLHIAIENPKGSTRSGVDPYGCPWETVMAHDYGYIKRTEGADGDHVDCFLGPEPGNSYVHIVNQKDPETGAFDEHKCMIGFPSRAAAIKGYLANYEDGWKGCGDVKTMHVDDFKQWLRHGDTTSRLVFKAAVGRLTEVSRLQMNMLKHRPGTGTSPFFTDALAAAKTAGVSNDEILRTVKNATGTFEPLLKHVRENA
jgi:hypothetical protein